ncbi:CoA transferase [Alteromonas sp. I4]|nr:CoA transferase [Alteromonas sp. I4]
MYSLLKGTTVLDLTTIVLGPYATQFLGDFGADVIKVENLSGDLFRSVRPGRSASMGAGFMNCNRNKRSLAIDLKTKAGKAVLARMVSKADVVVHNMRSSTAERLGISYEQLKVHNEQVVYCYAPGFGQQGEYAEKPAYDDIIQAESGVAYLNRDANGQPRFIPTIICDKVGGLHLAMAVLAGLNYRLREGKGCVIEAPMFESMVSFLMTEQLSGETFVPPLGGTGYERLNSPYRKPFPTADGYISILPYSTRHWQAFFTLIQQPDMVEHEYVTNPVLRSENVGSLYKIVSEVTPEKSTSEWIAQLGELDIPCAPVNDIASLLSDPHLQSQQFFSEFEHPTEGRLRETASPFFAKGVDKLPNKPTPLPGQDTASILRELGYGPDEIETLVESDTVFTGTKQG